MNVFYTTGILDDVVILDDAESHHAVKVLRMVSGDQLLILDGKGTTCRAEITNPHPKKCECKILEKSFREKRPVNLHIAIAPTKLNDRFEWFLEKATEIGIEEITPVICSRSERRQINHERYLKVLVAAMKQSRNPWLPVLNDPVDLIPFLAANQPGYIAHCMDGNKIPLKHANLTSSLVTILVGPEGDFTDAEVDTAVAGKWEPVSLGDTRLRTETAGIVACHTITLLKN